MSIDTVYDKLSERLTLWQKKYLSRINVLPDETQLIYIIAMDAVAALSAIDQEAIRREALLGAKAAIELDKSTFAGVGRDTKGHSRALMLIDEILADEPKEREAEDGDLVFWPMGDRGLVDFWDDEIEAACKRMGGYKSPVVLMRRSEVERKLKEAER